METPKKRYSVYRVLLSDPGHEKQFVGSYEAEWIAGEVADMLQEREHIWDEPVKWIYSIQVEQVDT